MWKFAAVLGLMGSALSAQNSEQIRLCATYGEFAAEVMMHRQDGVSLARILGVLTDSEVQEKAMTMEAFAVPRFHSPAGKQRAVDDYRNDVEIRCLN